MIARRLFGSPGFNWRDPFAELERMKREMDWLAGGLFGTSGLRQAHAGVFPAVNVTENKDNYFIRAELPGLNAGDLDIQSTGNSLTISGERKISAEKEAKYHRREREAGKFSRVINLPEAINNEKIDAGLVNGILTVTIPKSEIAKPKKIAVK